jgi:diguanylate cyclase (GGDEF)-like protein
MDSLILITTIITFSWYFILGPTLLQGDADSLPTRMLTCALSISDLLVISFLILLSRSTVDRSLRITIRGLSLAMVIFVLTDSILAYLFLSTEPGLAINLGWIGGIFVVALSLHAMRWLPGNQASQRDATPHPSSLVAMPMWRSLLAYMLIPVVIGLVFYLWETDRTSALAIGTYSCSLLLLVVIFIKQIVVMREIHGLNQGFQRLQRVLNEKNMTLEQANARLDALATTDPLTELPNHRALVSVLDQELARCEQYAHKCSVLFFDLDHFKALNDSYGHTGGDTALREFGSLVRATLPSISTIGRWGGEEFVVLLPEQDTTQASLIAEQLRSAVSNYSFSIGGGMHLTCSIGIASYPAHAQQRETLLQATDSAMYGAKRLGRNQVRVIDDPAVTALLATSSEIEGRDEAALIGTVHALALLVDERDAPTGKHSQHVGTLLLQLAQSLGFSAPEASQFSLIGQLHDIGKIVVADQILNKQEPLTESELASLRRHPQVGADVVSCIPSLRPLAPVIHAHHERWDGTGYPDQLAGETIPLGARLLAVVDAYVVMIDGRTYQPAVSPREALEELQRRAGTQFDPQAVEALTRMLQDTPEHRAEYESEAALSDILA